MQYTCRLCSFKTLSPLAYIKHFRVHSNVSKIPCGVMGCTQYFRKLSTCYSHVSRFHFHDLQKQKKKHYFHNTGLMIRCSVEHCDVVLNYTDLVKHLKGHIVAGVKVQCPVEGCGRPMRNVTTFTAHISVKHNSLSQSVLNRNLVVGDNLVGATHVDDGNDTFVDSEHANDTAYQGSGIDACLGTDNELQYSDVQADEPIDKTLFVHNCALFFLRLQCRCFVPLNTIESIATELYSLQQLGLEASMNALRVRLLADGLPVEQIDDIISEIKKNDVFRLALGADEGILRSQHTRRCFYKENLRYVEPVQKVLGRNRLGKLSICHYVPVRQTLSAMLQDESVLQCLDLNMCRNEKVFGDLQDGELYKGISTEVGRSFIELILYQDAFEIVNPLGSARSVYKIVAVYMALANLPVHKRTCSDNVQLVMLCREHDLQYFGQQIVFQCLVEDLCDLESNGLLMDDRTIPVRLVCVLGDNLGSHWLGGFSTNFTTSQYVCRYCLVQRTDDHCSLSQTCELRTPENYDNAVSCLDDVTKSFQGIKHRSVLHSLKFFHVCKPGLPPCLGHDLFEGVVQFDLALILKQLCRDTAMSMQRLNWAVQNFKFIGADGRDKPGSISDGKTVGGHAVQVWCLLRFLPFFVYDVVDVDDKAWDLLLLLREVVELVCAPKVSDAQILHLNRLVQLYVSQRSELFPNVALRPKHHYLLHYPWLTQMFGPLLCVWTMRLESKHSFFKRCARNSRNFVNITKTLSESHQLNQAFLSSGPAVLCDECRLGGECITFDEKLFSPSIVFAVKLCEELRWPLKCSSSIFVKGTKYCNGAYVVVDCVTSQPVFGKIALCLIDSAGIAAVVIHTVQSWKNHSLGLYRVDTDDMLGTKKCMLVGELLDYFPLSTYDVSGSPHIAMKHAVYINVDY